MFEPLPGCGGSGITTDDGGMKFRFATLVLLSPFPFHGESVVAMLPFVVFDDGGQETGGNVSAGSALPLLSHVRLVKSIGAIVKLYCGGGPLANGAAVSLLSCDPSSGA